jgi:hypothetical protein
VEIDGQREVDAVHADCLRATLESIEEDRACVTTQD